jgi:predicted PurR-regulated permease PerM
VKERPLLQLAALVVVIAGMRAAADLLVQFLIAAFLAVICAAPVFWLERRRVPRGLAALLVVGALLGFLITMGGLIAASLRDFSDNLPTYQQRLGEQQQAVFSALERIGVELPKEGLMSHLDGGKVMALAASLLKGLGGGITHGAVTLFFVIFILVEAGSFPVKLHAALGDAQPHLAKFHALAGSIRRYLAIKTWISLASGVVIFVWVWLFGLNYALLWGLLAFLLSYIPTVGAIIASVPAILLALVELGFGKAAVLAAGIVAFNLILGKAIEPRFMGHGLGLSPLAVLVSLFGWGWVLGPVGLFLSVPLTLTLKIILESDPQTHWLAVLLGPEAEAKA